jgi:hypothetical protein
MLKRFRNSGLYAFLMGFWEGASDFGRTHPTDQDWNERYDQGRALRRMYFPGG